MILKEIILNLLTNSRCEISYKFIKGKSDDKEKYFNEESFEGNGMNGS
jgi:hypothetical protein